MRVATILLLILLTPAAWARTDSTVSARMAAIRARFASRAPAPRIHDVQLPPGAARQFARFEVSFLLDASYTNPFDPDDIAVEAQVTLPDGTQAAVPAFYFIPYEPANGVTQLQGSIPFGPPGRPSWRLRFSPPRPGRYRFSLVARDAAGQTARSEEYTFEAMASRGPGFLQVSATNPTYFEDSATGKPFVGTGANIAWTRDRDPGTPTACYEYYFGRARGLMSATRVWMCHWAWLEWTPQVVEEGTTWDGYGGLGYYNQMIAAEFDRVFALAEENGLRVMLVTEDNNEHFGEGGTEEWFGNPYNRINGGPCERPWDVFVSPAARKAYRNRLRYILARWGYSTSLWAINSWNDESEASPEVRDWLREMRDYVHGVMRGYRPIIYGSNFQADDLMDYAQADGGASKPTVSQECEFTQDMDWFVPTLRHQLWGGLARGLAAVMCWPHPTIDELDAWATFRPPLAFLQDLDLNHGEWRPAAAEVVSAGALPGEARQVITIESAWNAPGWGQRAEQQSFVIDAHQREQALPGLSSNLYGHGEARAAWRNPPTFVVNLPGDGEFVVDAEEIGGGDQVLEIAVDGAVVKRVPLTSGRRELRDSERRTVIPLSRGEHRITLDNAGGDWIRFRRCHLVTAAPSAASLVTVRGRSRADQAFLYLENDSYARLPRLLGAAPAALTDLSIRLGGMGDGSYRAVLFDTARGTEISTQQVTCRDGVLTVAVPRLEDDLSVKVVR